MRILETVGFIRWINDPKNDDLDWMDDRFIKILSFLRKIGGLVPIHGLRFVNEISFKKISSSSGYSVH